MDEIIPATTLMVNNKVRYRRLGQESVVIHQGNCMVLVLNDVGTRILELIDNDLQMQQILETLINEYDADPKELQSDLLAHIEELLDADIIYKV